MHGKNLHTLSKNEENQVRIPKEIVQLFEQQDIIALDFLTRSYKKLSGVILNEEEGFNPQLQVSAFLYAQQSSSSKCKLPILVICPDELIIKWHYNLTKCGYKAIKIATENNITEENSSVWMVCTSNIKVLQYLLEIEFYSVVADKIDLIANKRVLQKLEAKFRIGITTRNFYIDPDQKLQWTILNWANPGCVGKLIPFYEADNENFANFRDNYKEWWFRLTWNFCDSFVRPSLEDEGDMRKLLNSWAKQHDLLKYIYCHDMKPIKRKRKNNQKLCAEENVDTISESKRKTDKFTNNHKETPLNEKNTDSDDSNSTVVYDCTLTNNPIENAKLENSNCRELESKSSLDEILHSLINDQPEETLNSVHNYSFNGANDCYNSDDDSDMFLKSVASIDCFSSKKPPQETIENGLIFETNLTTNKTDDLIIASCTSDVDKLVSEVMQMVKK